MSVVPKPYLPPWVRKLELCYRLILTPLMGDSYKVVGLDEHENEVVRWSSVDLTTRNEISDWFRKVLEHREYLNAYRKAVLDETNDNDDNERESETMIKAEEIAEILTDNLRYVEVKFPNTIDKAYVYKVPNDVGTISTGDQVVVTTDYNREGTTHIVEVVAVYPNYTSVPSDKKRVKITKYIVNKIDFAPYNSAIKLEKEIVSFVETKQREAIRNQLRAAVTAEFPELLKFAQLEAPKPTETT